MSSAWSTATIISAALLMGAADHVGAQDYPGKPIRIVTGPTGGGSDFVARLVAQGLSGALGQPVVVENRGQGFIQADFMLKAAPDGYSLSVTGTNTWITPLLQKKPPYDVLTDFAPVSLISREISILIVHPSLPVKSVKELIALAKSRPKDLNYSSAGLGNPSHLAMELFKSMAGVSITHVAYKGGAQAFAALLSGEVQVAIIDAGVAGPQIKTGKARALAVTSAQPSALGPGLPTVAASGVPGFEAVGMTGMFAPGKTPPAIVNRVSQEISRYVSRPDVKEKFQGSRGELVGSTPEEFAAIIKADVARTRKVITAAGITAD